MSGERRTGGVGGCKGWIQGDNIYLTYSEQLLNFPFWKFGRYPRQYTKYTILQTFSRICKEQSEILLQEKADNNFNLI